MGQSWETWKVILQVVRSVDLSVIAMDMLTEQWMVYLMAHYLVCMKVELMD